MTFHSHSQELPQHFPGKSACLRLLPCPARRGALCHAWSISTPLTTCQAGRSYHQFELMQRCLAPCPPCKDLEGCSRDQPLLPEGLWRDRLEHFQMKMMGGEKSRAPGTRFAVSLPMASVPSMLFLLPAAGEEDEVGHSAHCRCWCSQHCIPPVCSAPWAQPCRSLTVMTVNALLKP